MDSIIDRTRNHLIFICLLISCSRISNVVESFTPTPSSFYVQQQKFPAKKKNILPPLNIISFNKQHSMVSNDTNAIIFETSPNNEKNKKSSLYVSILVSPTVEQNKKKQRTKIKNRAKAKAKAANKNQDKNKNKNNVDVTKKKIQEELLSQEVQEMNKKIEKHKHHKKRLDNLPCLVLNADYQPLSFSPISVWTWQETAKAVLCYSNKVTVVDTYPDIYINANNFTLPLPSVIAMNDYIPTWRRKKFRRVAFSRRNVYIRDEYTCQYCGRQYPTSNLSFDHVIPRSKGGRLTWSNVVTSCLSCNTKKGSLAVHELHKVGMKLLRKPYVPSIHELAIKAEKLSLSNSRMTKIVSRYHDSWVPFLGSIMSTSTSNTASIVAGVATNSTSV